MKCPRCGAEMNHHADKIFPGKLSEAQLDTDVEGDTVLELHSCPACGAAASRRGAM